MRLRRRHRDEVRNEALRFFADSEGDCVASDVESYIRTKFAGILGPILMQLAIKLAIELITAWLKKQLMPAEVPATYQADEPGWSEEDDDDGEE